MRRAALPTLSLALLLAAHELAAQEPVPPAEEPLLTRAQKTLAAGRIEEACGMLEKGLALERRFDLLVAAGQCHELMGKTATAFGEYTEASLLAEKEGDTTKQDRARELASKIAARVPKLRIDVLAPRADQIVRKNGAPVPRDDWGKLVMVDPGRYQIDASASGLQPFTSSVDLGAAGDVQVVLIPALTAAGAAGAPPLAPPAGSVGPKDGRRDTIDPLGIAGFVTVSFGALGIAMGTVFGVMTLSDVSSAEDDPNLCPGQVCTPAGRAVIDEAETKGIVSTVAFSVGGASMAAGITIFLVRELGGKKEPEPPRKTEVLPWLGPGLVGVRGSF